MSKFDLVNTPQVANWLRLTLQGDEGAASSLVEYAYPQVMRVIGSRVKNPLTQEDTSQMVLIKIITRLGQYSGRVPFLHWVSRIAVNTAINIVKKEARYELRKGGFLLE